MLQGVLILVVFLVVAALMMTKKIPTLLALPLMAVLICVIAGCPRWVQMRTAPPSAGCKLCWKPAPCAWAAPLWRSFLGAWLGQLMNKTGVTENIIKKCRAGR